MPVDEFCQWILSNDYRRYTTIRRVDLVKSTQARHAFHESLMFHVYGALEGGEKRKDKRLNGSGRTPFASWRIIMERAGTIPQESQVSFSLFCSVVHSYSFYVSKNWTFRRCPLQKRQNLLLSILDQQRIVL